MSIDEFIHENNVDFSAHPIDEANLKLAENYLNVKFGSQLSKYLLNYGYLGFGSVEFYGINARQILESDMITQTLYLHKYFSATNSYIALENCGEGNYMLVNSEDNVFCFVSEKNEFAEISSKLFDYILCRFRTELNRIEC